MINTFKKITKHKKLLQNFASLSSLQFFNYLFPFITLPYVVRVLGPEKYGLINFAAAFAAYFVMLTDYGFNLSATRQVSVNRDNKEKLNEIFSSVVFTKVILGIISLVVFSSIVFVFVRFSSVWAVYLMSFGFVIASILFPLWLYQGLERMKYIPIIHFFPRVIGVVLIFTLIKKEEDFLLLVVINSAVQILIGIAGMLAAVMYLDIKFVSTSLQKILFQLREGKNIFKSTVAINLYTNSNAFLLGLLTNNEIVGYYAAADKLRMAFQSILSTISQSVYPHVNFLLKESLQKMIDFNKKLLKYQTIISFIISLTVFLLSEQIINILLGSEFTNSIMVLKIICWIPFLVSFSNVFGIQTRLPLGYDKPFFKIVTTAALINIILAFILIPSLFAVGTSIAFLITEVFVSISMFYYLKKHHINFISQ